MTAQTRAAVDAANALGVSVDYLLREARAGRVPHVRIARQVRFTDAQLAQIIADHTVDPAPPPAPPPSTARRRRPDTYVRTP